jgi:hypothetical protein
LSLLFLNVSPHSCLLQPFFYSNSRCSTFFYREQVGDLLEVIGREPLSGLGNALQHVFQVMGQLETRPLKMTFVAKPTATYTITFSDEQVGVV